MSDFERQLREVMDAAVADAQPPSDVMELVRRRHRRRNARLAGASAVALAVLVAAVPVAGALRGGGGPPAHRHGSSAPLFPGGGRILTDHRGVLEWLYPDGRTVWIASGFAGATLAGGKLLAWKNVNPPGASRFLPRHCFDPECTRFIGQSYYTMNLDGSDSRLVLPAERPVGNAEIWHADVQLSPDGSKLGYVRYEQLRNGSTRASELWTVNLKTRRKTDLGPDPGPFAWKDSTTMLAQSADGRALELISATSGNRATYLSVDDRRMIRAYEAARPGNGPPVSIGLDGWSPGPGPAVLAVTLAGRFQIGRDGSMPAEFLIEKTSILAFAPGRQPWILLTWQWGPDGVFLLRAKVGTCDCPDTWSNATYTGTARKQVLSRQQTFGDPWNAAVFNPAGNVIAFWYSNGGAIGFVPVSAAACGQAGRCLHFQPKPLYGRGTLLAWAP